MGARYYTSVHDATACQNSTARVFWEDPFCGCTSPESIFAGRDNQGGAGYILKNR
jgi:hypothetical protein